ncbi:MAG: exo-alpha-sialidase, partial [Bacteroidetes bacterium]|nr:exo-alpha-sialidase [Bacteroidota bacterium]
MKNFAFYILCFIPFLGISQQKTTVVFRSGEDGYKSYRIPAIVTLPNGNIIAFCEGRKEGAADFGDVDIVMKKSSDKGKTWSKISVIIDYDKLQAGNAAPVVDTMDPKYPNGRIFLFYNTGNNHEYDVRAGKGMREAWYTTSTDGGKTWTPSQNITTEVHRPNNIKYNPKYNFPEDWRATANTPGHAIQILNGKYKGRILVAANHSSGEPKNDFSDYDAHAFYSDDHGKTFQLTKPINFPGSNESTAVELSNGKIMLNSRNQKGDIRARIVTISQDGGTTWGNPTIDNNLPDPVNEGSLLYLGKFKKKTYIAFSNTADPKYRDNLTLRISDD